MANECWQLLLKSEQTATPHVDRRFSKVGAAELARHPRSGAYSLAVPSTDRCSICQKVKPLGVMVRLNHARGRVDSPLLVHYQGPFRVSSLRISLGALR